MSDFNDDTMSPTSGPGGDGDQDDAAVEKYAIMTEGPHWEPEAWHKSPMQMESEARATNIAVHAHVAAYAGAHSNPPQMASQRAF